MYPAVVGLWYGGTIFARGNTKEADEAWRDDCVDTDDGVLNPASTGCVVADVAPVNVLLFASDGLAGNGEDDGNNKAAPVWLVNPDVFEMLRSSLTAGSKLSSPKFEVVLRGWSPVCGPLLPKAEPPNTVLPKVREAVNGLPPTRRLTPLSS